MVGWRWRQREETSTQSFQETKAAFEIPIWNLTTNICICLVTPGHPETPKWLMGWSHKPPHMVQMSDAESRCQVGSPGPGHDTGRGKYVKRDILRRQEFGLPSASRRVEGDETDLEGGVTW